MKQTAVEWLVEQLKENGVSFWQEEIEMIEEAKEMEKAEKIKTQIDILKLAHLRLSIEGIDKANDTMVFTINELEKQLKELTFKPQDL
jgi:hypothetical protein